MRSRSILVGLFIMLSGLLAFLPVIETTAFGTSQSPAPAAETAAQNKAKPKQKKRAAQKKKKLRQQRSKQQRRQQAKQQRNKQRAAGARQPAGANRVTARRLPGGPLRSAQARIARVQDVGERYIVVFESDRVNSRALTTTLGAEPGVVPTHIYEHAIKGFAARLTPAARRALEHDPRVRSVTRDRQRFLDVQTLPTGINRVDADLNPVAAINGGGPGVNVDIAIIDTGTDLEHPDLNVFAYLDCASDPESPDWGWDLDGHGTHVAGTAAAIDNGDGVVGVAPGARLWSMRVMDDDGFMFDSYIIDCMDAVAEFANTPFQDQTIDVANMSLGAEWPVDVCNGTDAFNDAVCAMVAAGVTTTVAAGNEASDAAGFNPANIDAVITVSALADSDGQPGGAGPAFSDACTNPEQDDSLASFSNFGADVDIAAPGVGILSTFPTYLLHYCTPAVGEGFDVFPGTSMASPHVAGAAGLLLAVNPNLSPAQVKAALQASREDVAMAGDPDGINEGILNLGDSGPGPGPGDNRGPNVAFNGPGSVRERQRFTLRVQANDPSGIARVELYLCQPGCRKVAQDATAPFTFRRRHNQDGHVRYKVRVFDRAGNFTEKSKSINIRPRR